MGVLIQPFEAMIVLGSAAGIFVINNPAPYLRVVMSKVLLVFKKIECDKSDYMDLLKFLFSLFRYIRMNNLLLLEKHIDSPNDSVLFKAYPKILENKNATELICDIMRLLTIGITSKYDLEVLIDRHIEARNESYNSSIHAIYKIADALPAIGIIAAVLGVINAMASINSEAAVLGQKIAAALIGTFLGVMISYCFVAPMASIIEKHAQAELAFLEAIKDACIAHASGFTPTLAVEFSRQALPEHVRPSFIELEDFVMRKPLTINRKKPRGDKHGR